MGPIDDVRGFRWGHPKIFGGQGGEKHPTKVFSTFHFKKKCPKMAPNSQHRHGVIWEPLFESCSSGAQYCELRLCLTVWRTLYMRRFHSKMYITAYTHSFFSRKLLRRRSVFCIMVTPLWPRGRPTPSRYFLFSGRSRGSRVARLEAH